MRFEPAKHQTSAINSIQTHATGEVTGFIASTVGKGEPMTVIGADPIRTGVDAKCLHQALNARGTTGVANLLWQLNEFMAAPVVPHPADVERRSQPAFACHRDFPLNHGRRRG